MALTPGTRLGPYEIRSTLGAGGMGEVYRATDTRLTRDVAIKVSGEQFAERFKVEARAIASLNHPNICTLHDVGPDYLVMELVEGPTLADRIAQGPMPIDEALALADQIAQALAAAHEQGIVHRDLKPANIKIKADGTVKVLDFGLAKAGGGPVSSSIDISPTISLAATQAGMILGTAAYMAPEQARGKVVDTRADIWAFGVVLYEMVTGRRLFDGESLTDTLAAVIEREADVSKAPARVQPLLRACLQKDPRRRLQDVGDARLLLDSAAPGGIVTTSAAPAALWRRVLWPAALIVTALAAAAITRVVSTPLPPGVLQFEIGPPAGGFFPGANLTPRMAISPDGRYLAFTINLRNGTPDQLWVRRLDTLDAIPLVQPTEGQTDAVQQPFWSPDSRSVGFFQDGRLRKVAIDGGAVQTITNVPGSNFGGAWSTDGTILFGTSDTKGLRRVSAGGGVPVQVTTVSDGEVAHNWPRFLPDGRRFLYLALTASADNRAIYVGSLDSPDRTRLLMSRFMVDFVAPDRLVFVRDDALLAQRVDMDTMQLLGEPAALAEGVQGSLNNGRAGFSVSAGVLAYRRGQGGLFDMQLVMVDRTGRELRQVAPDAPYRGVELSPDGRRAALHREDGDGSGDLWILDIERGSSVRLTFDSAAHNVAPVWSRDGRQIVFGKTRQGSFGLFVKDASGIGDERLVYETKNTEGLIPWSIAGDGTVLFGRAGEGRLADMLTLPLAGDTGTPVPYVTDPGRQNYAQISPDGRWVAYASDESGRYEVYVRSFPKGETRYQVSTAAGSQPRWRGDGRALFHTAPAPGSTVIMEVGVEQDADGLRFGTPEQLFDAGILLGPHATAFSSFAATPDGQRFLIARGVGTAEGSLNSLPIAVVVNWDAGLR